MKKVYKINIINGHYSNGKVISYSVMCFEFSLFQLDLKVTVENPILMHDNKKKKKNSFVLALATPGHGWLRLKIQLVNFKAHYMVL